MQKVYGPTRRRFLEVGTATALVAASLAGCDALSTEPDDQGDEGDDAAGEAKEAPMLAELVDTGELPPVEERLPDKPLVVEPVERVGVYGGALHSGLWGPANRGYIYSTCYYDNLLRWSTEWTGAAGLEEIEPNVAERFEVNDDATEFTFWLRPGMRWSDGADFTIDDVVFAVDDVLLNSELRPQAPTWLMAGGEPATIEVLDDSSFKLVFAESAGTFLHSVAQPQGVDLTRYPRHYLEQFHADYNPEVADLVAEEGAEDWVGLFGLKAPGWGENPDLPTLAPWRLVTGFGEASERVTLERNPYYWKVDSDGGQLPYLDEVVFDIVPENEVMLLRMLGGEMNWEAGPAVRFANTTNKPVLADGRTDGGYDFIDVIDARMNAMVIHLNLAHEDETKREVFRNKDFRIGLSHAINRAEVIDTVLRGQGEPYQTGPLPESPFYDEEMATQYLAYDVDLANEALDKVLPDVDGDGMRLGPDGERFSFTLEFAANVREDWSDMLELVKAYWQDVGVEVNLKSEDRTLWNERSAAAAHDAGVWTGVGGLDVLQLPRVYVPIDQQAFYAVPWAQWYNSGGAEGEETPQVTRDQLELYTQFTGAFEADEQADLMTQILQIAKEQFYVMGVARDTGSYFVKANNLHNVPNPMVRSWPYPTPGPTNPEQYFLDS